MSRTLSLVALATLLLATAVEAYSGASEGKEGYRRSADKIQNVATGLLVSTNDVVAALQGDKCGVEGYPWLNADGQPVKR